jgi:outer membrane immunogenic protein
MGRVGNAVAGTVESINGVRNGWTVGGGAAYAFAQNWNVFAEYRYTMVPSTTITFPIAQRSYNNSSTTNTIELGLNYKFDWAGPILARY